MSEFHILTFYFSLLFRSTVVLFTFQDEYSRLSRNASLGVHGYVLVFSITSRQSFDRISQVNESLLDTLGDAPDVPRVLVGSMKDLEGQRQVSQSENWARTGSEINFEREDKTGTRKKKVSVHR